jgi:hypothetical protein
VRALWLGIGARSDELCSDGASSGSHSSNSADELVHASCEDDFLCHLYMTLCRHCIEYWLADRPQTRTSAFAAMCLPACHP